MCSDILPVQSVKTEELVETVVEWSMTTYTYVILYYWNAFKCASFFVNSSLTKRCQWYSRQNKRYCRWYFHSCFKIVLQLFTFVRVGIPTIVKLTVNEAIIDLRPVQWIPLLSRTIKLRNRDRKQVIYGTISSYGVTSSSVETVHVGNFFVVKGEHDRILRALSDVPRSFLDFFTVVFLSCVLKRDSVF